MTYIEQIHTLAARQQEAAHQLMAHRDERHAADALHAGVPTPIISYISGLGGGDLRDVTARLDARDRAMTSVD